MYERQLLRELEALRGDVSNAAKKVSPAANSTPKPSVVPPLEDFSKPPLPRPVQSASALNGFQTPPRIQSPQQSTHSYSQGPLPHGPLPRGPLLQEPLSQGPSSQPSSSTQTAFSRQEPLSTPSRQGPLTPSSPQSPVRRVLPPQSPGAGPSSPTSQQVTLTRPPVEDEPPLGGRFVDGTKSMFVKRTSSPLSPSHPTSSSSTFSSGPLQRAQAESPLHSSPLHRAATSPLIDSPPRGMNGHAAHTNAFDPLGHGKPNYMSSSVRVQPTRPRLDAREAASKLANMF